MQQFLSFCREQEPDRTYEWYFSAYCALGQFNGFNSEGWDEDFNLCNEIAFHQPQTFGALARRLAEQMLAEQMNA
jgi:hypothetical protein